MRDQNDTILSLEPCDVLLNRYRLVRVLGEGGMGLVWLAHDGQLDRDVALKVLPVALSRDKRAIARLKEEAKRNLELTQDNIVRLYTFEQDLSRGGVAFLVMQYIEGETLDDLLADHPDGLSPTKVLKWAEQVGEAIDYAHRKGLLHRDIKPSNIIIERESGDAYLMDFGIAREARDTMTRVTGSQDSSGTLPYMSPQQLMGKNRKSNDVYSFAITLYEALSGDAPFKTGDIASQIRETSPEPIAFVSDIINRALLSGLAKSAEERPESCGALLGLVNTPPTPAPPPKKIKTPARDREDETDDAGLGRTDTQREVVRTGAKRTWPMVIFVSYALAIIGLFVFMTYQGGTEDGNIPWGAVTIICAVFALLVGGTLLLPVRVASRRPVKRGSVWVTMITGGALAGFCALTIFWAMAELFSGGPEFSDAMGWVGIGLGAIVWPCWTIVLWRATRDWPSIATADRVYVLLIRGSILELLVAVPCHLWVRRRDECSVGLFTGSALVVGTLVCLVAIGPAMLLLYAKRVNDITVPEQYRSRSPRMRDSPAWVALTVSALLGVPLGFITSTEYVIPALVFWVLATIAIVAAVEVLRGGGHSKSSQD